MSDVLLLYLFTRLDAMAVASVMFTILSGVIAVLCFVWRSMAADEKRLEDQKAWASYAKTAATFFVVLAFCAVAIPSQRDMAIIVGGKVALNAGRSDTANAVGQEVLDAIRAQLRKAAEK